MRTLLKQMEEKRVSIDMTVDEAHDLKILLEKHVLRKGRPTQNTEENECPSCGTIFHKGANYCSCCGQWIDFNESDVLPFE